MAKLDTVTVWDKKKKRLRTFNAVEYSLRHLISDRFTIVTQSRGDASPEQTRNALREAKVEIARRNNPAHPASKDRERAYEYNQARPDIRTSDYKPVEPQPVEIAETREIPAEDMSSEKRAPIRGEVETVTGIDDAADATTSEYELDPDIQTTLTAEYRGFAKWCVIDTAADEVVAKGLDKETAQAIVAGDLPIPQDG